MVLIFRGRGNSPGESLLPVAVTDECTRQMGRGIPIPYPRWVSVGRSGLSICVSYVYGLPLGADGSNPEVT